MKKRTVWMLTALMAIALIGVCVVQIYYIRQSYALNSQLFDQQINQVLSNVVEKYQKHEIAHQLDRHNKQTFEERFNRKKRIIETYEKAKKAQEERFAKIKRQQEKEIENYLNYQDSLIRSEYIEPIIISETDFKALRGDKGYKDKAKLSFNITPLIDSNGKITNGIVQRDFQSSEKAKTFKITDNDLPDTIRYIANKKKDGLAEFIELPRVSEELAEKFKLQDKVNKIRYSESLIDTTFLVENNLNLIQDVASEMKNKNISIKNRVNISLLDSLIHNELSNKHIPLNYNFSVSTTKGDSTVFFKKMNSLKVLRAFDFYVTPLFKNDIFRDQGLLKIYLPSKNNILIKNLSPTLLTSGGLILILLFIFSFTIISIIKQKKLAEMKIDFINNMTHEFKTPVSTIMIASESLKDPELNKDMNRVQRLANIIYEENVRLGHNIERVLNIAKLEKNNLILVNNNIDLNELVEAVVDSMELQLQKNNVNITLNLFPESVQVIGDELHLSNVIYNLIDNANKYSSQNPMIEISTEKTVKCFIFKIKDNGIGMTKDQQKRIFEQFYRVPTGNLHNVKGFGLGLNYVQYIVKEMNGSIKLKSEKDKGSQFELIFPI